MNRMQRYSENSLRSCSERDSGWISPDRPIGAQPQSTRQTDDKTPPTIRCQPKARSRVDFQGPSPIGQRDMPMGIGGIARCVLLRRASFRRRPMVNTINHSRRMELIGSAIGQNNTEPEYRMSRRSAPPRARCTRRCKRAARPFAVRTARDAGPSAIERCLRNPKMERQYANYADARRDITWYIAGHL